MKNDKFKELKDNEMAQVTGGTRPHCHFEQVAGDMPKPTPDEKYVMLTSAPTSPEIIEELRS